MAWDAFLLDTGVTEDATRGHLALRVSDCDLLAAEGVSVSLDTADGATSLVYTAKGGIPRPGAVTTDATGWAIFLNVPPGPVAATATLASTGQVIGTIQVLVRAGFVTGSVLPPTP